MYVWMCGCICLYIYVCECVCVLCGYYVYMVEFETKIYSCTFIS